MMKTYRQELKAEALVEQLGRCHYCKEPLPATHATADHKWPQSRRGRTTKENIVAACLACNSAKGSRSHIEFYRLIDRKIPRGERMEIILVWARRKLWKRTHAACDRIERRAV